MESLQAFLQLPEDEQLDCTACLRREEKTFFE